MCTLVHLKPYSVEGKISANSSNALFLSTVQFYDVPTLCVNNTGNTGSFKKSPLIGMISLFLEMSSDYRTKHADA